MNTILHLGLGSFHRAHQAVYVHQLRQSGDLGWAIAAGNLRPDMPDTIAALQAQGGAYTLETVTPQGEKTYTRVTSIQRVIPYQDDLAPLVAVGADAATRIISFASDYFGTIMPNLELDKLFLPRGDDGRAVPGSITYWYSDFWLYVRHIHIELFIPAT